MPEVQVVPDRNRAADLGVSMAAIGETVNAAIGGVRVGKFKDKGRRFDIRGRLLAPAARSAPRTSPGCSCAPASGELVRLGELIRIDQEPTLQAITRRDRERAITIFANVAAGASQAEAVDRSLEIAREVLPDGYRAVVVGQHQGVPRVVPVAVVRLRARPAHRLHGARLAVQLVLAPGRRSCWRCRSRSAARSSRSGSAARA